MQIKEVIKANGFTIEAVAKEMKISRVTLSQNISGNPSYTTMKRIANVIGCNVGDFFADELGNTIVCPHCGKSIQIEAKEA